jgi:hypothetical protein
VAYALTEPMVTSLAGSKLWIKSIVVGAEGCCCASLFPMLRHLLRQAPAGLRSSSWWPSRASRPAFARAMASSTHSIRAESPLPMGARSPKPARRVVVLGAGNFGSCLADVRPRVLRASHHTLGSDGGVRSTSRTRRTTCGCGRATPRSSRTSTRTTGTRRACRTMHSHGVSPPLGPRCRRARSSRGRTSCCSRFPPRAFGASLPARSRTHADHGYRETLTKLRPLLDPAKLPLLIFVNKGIEISTRALTLEIIADTCGREIAHAATFIVCAHMALPGPNLTVVASLALPSRKRVSRIGVAPVPAFTNAA